jgi:hypothetical protein
MTKPIKDHLCALSVGLAMLPALANVAQGAPAPNAAANQAVISQLAGKSVASAKPQELANAVKQAIRANPTQAKNIVRAVFSQLGAKDRAKARAVMHAVAAVAPPGDLAGLVQAAVEALSTESAGGSGLSARSALGTVIAQEASALVPSEARAIANAVGSLFSSSGGGGGAPGSFQGPGNVSNPANFSNTGGSVNSPSGG